MGAFQTCGCLSVVIRTVLITESLLTGVRGDGDSTERTDIKYALIGAGIGLFLAAGFIIVLVCIIRKRVQDNDTVSRMKRPSEPLVLALSHRPSQSAHPVEVVSNDAQC